MDISSVTGTSSIGGIDQPIIGRKTIEHEIRLRDGEVSLLGGMLEDQQTRSVSGIPGLSQIPILKYLFSQTQTDHSENEIVFVLIPHIVREPDLDAASQKAIDVGTANSIQLRRIAPLVLPAAVPATPNQAPAAAPTTQNSAPAQPPPQPAVAGGASFSFDPPSVTQATGTSFAVNILLSGAQNVYSVPLQLSYDPKLLQVANISNGSFLSQDGQAVVLVHSQR